MSAMGIAGLVLVTALLSAGVAPTHAAFASDGPAYAQRSASGQSLDDTTVATPSPSYHFVGVISSPERGKKIVHVNGDLVVDPVGCPRSPVDGHLPYYTNAGFVPVGQHSEWTHERAPVHYSRFQSAAFLDSYVTLAAGTYELRMWGHYYEPDGSVFRDCGKLSGQTVTVVDRVVTVRGITADDTTIIQGARTAVHFTERITWTDGVTTETVPRQAAGLSLQVRVLGTAAWSTESRTYPAFETNAHTRRVVMPSESVEYRFLQNGEPSRSLVVTVAQPTLGRIVDSASVSDSEVMMGATIEIAARLQTQYTDGVWRPSPAGTAFEVQFLPAAGAEWIRLYRDAIEDAGDARLRIPVQGAGRYRITSGGGVGPSIAVALAQPTSQIAIESPDLPTQVSAGVPIDLSVPIEIRYSDGIYRPAPDGTAYRVQFATSGPRSSARWRTVARGFVRDGVVAATIRPTATGYWRVTIAGAKSSAVLVRVRGR